MLPGGKLLGWGLTGVAGHSGLALGVAWGSALASSYRAAQQCMGFLSMSAPGNGGSASLLSHQRPVKGLLEAYCDTGFQRTDLFYTLLSDLSLSLLLLRFYSPSPQSFPLQNQAKVAEKSHSFYEGCQETRANVVPFLSKHRTSLPQHHLII